MSGCFVSGSGLGSSWPMLLKVEAGLMPPGLGPGDVHFWSETLPAHEADFYAERFAQLSPDEQERARRYRFEKDRAAFVESRFFLRSVLARYLHINPADVAFTYGEKGKPFLGPGMPDSRIQFNLSHCRGLVICGIVLDHQIGVDVEEIRALEDILAIARQVFSPNELRQILYLEPEARLQAFYRCWTRKEAYIKATGEGISADLRSIDVPVLPGEHEANGWTWLPLDVGSGFTAHAALHQPAVVLPSMSRTTTSDPGDRKK